MTCGARVRCVCPGPCGAPLRNSRVSAHLAKLGQILQESCTRARRVVEVFPFKTALGVRNSTSSYGNSVQSPESCCRGRRERTGTSSEPRARPDANAASAAAQAQRLARRRDARTARTPSATSSTGRLHTSRDSLRRVDLEALSAWFQPAACSRAASSPWSAAVTRSCS
jgi:hypothetical protein